MKTFLFLLISLCSTPLFAQLYKVTPEDLSRKRSYLLMRDGSVMRGQILRQDSTLISVRKRDGDMSFVEADQVVGVSAQQPMLPARTAQVSSTGPYRLFVFRDGSQVEGEFVRRDSTMITVRKRNGQLTYFEPELLLRTDSIRVETYTDTSRNFVNRFSPWMLTGTTAFMPEKGRFYYRNTWLLQNEFQYGITRFWSVGANFITPIPYLILADGFYGTGQFVRDNSQLFTRLSATVAPTFRLGLNASYQLSRQTEFFYLPNGVFTIQGLATIGSRQRNVTVSYGITMPGKRTYTYYFYQPGWSSSAPQTYSVDIPNRQFIRVGTTQKMGRSVTFISDNSVNLGDTYGYYARERVTASAAIRINRRRHAFDLGVYSLIYGKPYIWDNERSVRFFPYAGYNLIIGRD